MYRAVTRKAIQMKIGMEQAESLTEMVKSLDIQLKSHNGIDNLVVDGENTTKYLREPEIDQSVSLVSKIEGVRDCLVERQRTIAKQGKIIMVGRDIGTVVLPDADLKIYLDAPVKIRAKRRYIQILDKDPTTKYIQVYNQLIRRDKIDSEREVSPLRPAKDAVVIETEHLGVGILARKIGKLAGIVQ